ncbi:MAG TPA: hypothetical protein VFJ43_09825 [Bacteroidia bacterium]|nr:hypothetical protein [Bacteroidia bacterium]
MRKAFFLLSVVLIISCKKKDNTPPDLQFKTGTGYTSTNLTISPGGTFTVGMVANKGADDLNMFYTEVAFDGANTASLVSRIYMTESERKHAEHDITVTCRNQPGNERWIFDVNDGNGRITKKEIKVTVQ